MVGIHKWACFLQFDVNAYVLLKVSYMYVLLNIFHCIWIEKHIINMLTYTG